MGAKQAVKLTPKGRAAVQRVVHFFQSCLVHLEGSQAGKPFKLLPWQVNDFLGPVFGQLRPDGLRLIRHAHLDIAKKNGKSALGSGLGLYLAFADGERGARVAAAAGDKYQARVVFDDARKMVRASPVLSRICEVQKDQIIGPNDSVFEVISADAETKHGPKYSGIIFDEIHTQPKTGRTLWDVITPGISSRDQPLIVSLTTAGKNKVHLWHDLRERSLAKMANPKQDRTFWGLVYAAPEDADIFSEATWRMANPSLGAAVKLDYLRDMAEQARKDPKTEALFRWLHLNQPVDTTTRWITGEEWDQCVLSLAS